MRTTVLLLMMLVPAATAAAQSQLSPVHVGCIGQGGDIYAVAPGVQPLKPCLPGDRPLVLGSLSEVQADEGLTVNASPGLARLGLDPAFRLPRACAPGATATYDGTVWTCAAASVPTPAHTAWIGLVTNAADMQRVGRSPFDRPGFDREVASSSIQVLNASDAVTRIGCTFFDSQGVLQLDLAVSRATPPGALANCGVARRFWGWVLVTSETPVLPAGYNRVLEGSPHAWNVQWYPLDCRRPAGFEFACQFVDRAQ